ncbi:DUF2931 family protein [Pedobacter sp. KR3-3]|uniref:DUF2931 family protein n=1 Tax=Pedobacter albus TaxID=3113905 RepID=A0ABU7I3D6_9SPHI|nr:DUF2931 family protein [Pedobacter sp. KR3-3]MEE1943981.1 DUF2931 family protein [Pedobacter sp. KR3-3]
MKWNFINKTYFALSVILFVAIGLKILRYKSWDRYYYFSSVSTPHHFPIALRNCYFLLPNSDEDAYFNTENVYQFNSVWGSDYFFAEVHEPQRLPEKLVVEYVSYREKSFYSDTIPLPTEKIKAYFKEAEKHNQLEKMYHAGADKKGLKFHLGIANNGHIILWLRGINMEKLLLKTQLKSHEPSKAETFYAKQLTKEAYFKKVFERLPDSLRLEFEKGTDAKANYIDSPSHYLEREQ